MSGAIMVSRRGARTIWVPAWLLWSPLALLGAWFMTGLQAGATSVGESQWTVRLLIPAPQTWFDDPVMGTIGAVLLGLGFIAWLAAQWQPDPRAWRFTATRFPAFRLAAGLVLSFAVLSTWNIDGLVPDADVNSGFTVRFIATLRSGVWNLTAAIVGYVVAVGLYALSIGSPWAVVHPESLATQSGAAEGGHERRPQQDEGQWRGDEDVLLRRQPQG